MPVFQLTPVEDMRWHADWTSSEHEGECFVVAEDEEHARQLAAKRFRAPLLPPYVEDPWTQRSLVTARLKHDATPPGFPIGMVLPLLEMRWAD
ncbi:hypothetical protein [Roseomonas elaeocarpi]|uniref:Uncharacterized protein n=1 Tax=Roseomonas elaeocarpi TaxID=907779 RepID=A0ABV6JQF7_9PROT